MNCLCFPSRLFASLYFPFSCLSSGYLGDSTEEQEEWNLYDACIIVGTVPPGKFDDILIDCGTADSFLKAGQLLPEVSPINFTSFISLLTL